MPVSILLTLLVLQHEFPILCWGARYQHPSPSGKQVNIYPAKIIGAKIQVIQTMDIHHMLLNWKCAPWHNFSPCKLSPRKCLRIFILLKFSLWTVKPSDLYVWAHLSSDLKSSLIFLTQLPMLAQFLVYFSFSYRASGKQSGEGAVVPTTGTSCQPNCCLSYWSQNFPLDVTPQSV